MLTLIDHRRAGANKYTWIPPFDSGVPYENERWWDEPRYYTVDEPWFVQTLEDGREVARAELDDPGGINPEYTGVPALGPERLEIQFFEVALAARRHHPIPLANVVFGLMPFPTSTKRQVDPARCAITPRRAAGSISPAR